MIKIVPFHPKHLIDMPPLLGCYEGDFDLPSRIASLYGQENCYIQTLFNGDLPVAVVGATKNWHILTIWAAASEAIKDCGFGYHKAVKKLLAATIKHSGAKRVQSLVSVDNESAVKQHIHMGFNIEGKLSKSGPAMQDEYLFARVF